MNRIQTILLIAICGTLSVFVVILYFEIKNSSVIEIKTNQKLEESRYKIN